MGKIFLIMSPRVIKAKLFDYIKMKHFIEKKNLMDKIRLQTTKWKVIYNIHGNGQTPLTYYVLFKINKKKMKKKNR